MKMPLKHSKNFLYHLLLLIWTYIFIVKGQSNDPIIPNNILKCVPLKCSFNATRSDESGRTCWNIIQTTFCTGWCISYETPDWQFPYKISRHPVCTFREKVLKSVTLKNCDSGVDPELQKYEYYETNECVCKMCESEDTKCAWLPPDVNLSGQGEPYEGITCEPYSRPQH